MVSEIVETIVIGLNTHLLPGIWYPSDGGEKPYPLFPFFFLMSVLYQVGKVNSEISFLGSSVISFLLSLCK